MARPLSTISIALLAFAPLAGAEEKITFDDHVLPVFQQSCLNCHNPDKTRGGLDLSTYTGAMKGGSGGKIAEPGDTGSRLLAVVMHTAEPVMPPEGDKLSSAQIAVLRSWIEGGLLENKTSTARKPSKPKFDTALRSDPSAKPDGPPPMPEHLLLDPPVLAPRASAIHAIAASPWAPLLAVTGQRQVLLFDTNSLELTGVLPFPEGDPVSLAFTPNGRYLITGGGVPGKSGVTVTFDIVTGERMLVAAREFDSVLAADLRPDLSAVATGSPSRLIKIWKADDGEQLHSIKKHTEWVTALDYSPDGILLATGDRNGGVWVWEADSGNEFHTLRAHQAGITAAVFRADSNILATASEDGTVRFWEMNGGSEIRKIDAHPGGVLAFAWSVDGHFITAGRDRAVKLWKPDFNLLREFKDQPDIPLAVAFDADGKRAFAADYRGHIAAWNVENGDPLGNFDANPPSIEQRLISLREEIRKHPETVAAAENEAAATARKLEEARSQLAQAQGAVQQSRDIHAAAMKGKQEHEQRLEQARQQHAEKTGLAAQARDKAAAVQQETDAKRAALSSLDQRIDSARGEQEQAAAELKRLEDELAKARAEERHDAIAGLEASIQAQQPKADESARILEEIRSERAREEAALTEIETRRKTAAEETAKLDAELAALAGEIETLPATIAGATQAATDAEAKIKEREAAIKPLADAIPPLEQETGRAAAGVEAAKQRLPALQSRERHWTAAGINTEALAIQAEAARREAEAEDLVAEFQALAKSVEELGKHLQENPSSVEKDLAELSSLTAKLTAAKRKADECLPEVHALKTKAEDLKARYLALRAN